MQATPEQADYLSFMQKQQLIFKREVGLLTLPSRWEGTMQPNLFLSTDATILSDCAAESFTVYVDYVVHV